jgi:hypothetical protein
MRTTAPGIYSAAFVLILVGLVTFNGSSVAAQGAGAALVGQVTDESGAVLPGVTVTATSLALQVPQVTDVTNAQGEYRLAPLPVGVYDMTFELSGFQSVQRQAVRLTVGFTARIDVQLGVGAVAETVTVSAVSPVVDVASTGPSTLLTKEALSILPTTRHGVMSLVTLAPGVRSFVDVGGSAVADGPRARAFGQGGQVWYTIDGLSTTTPTNIGTDASYWDAQTIEEARVQTLGSDAEAPTRGVQVYAIVKSGGNDFHGTGFWGQTGQKLQSNNLDDRLREEGITLGNRVDTQYDINGDLGGRLVRDKLWFYTAARRRHNELNVLGALKPDGSPANHILTARYFTQKFSFQATPSHRLSVLNVWSATRDSQKNDALRTWESREDKELVRPLTKVEWEGVRGNSLIANLLYGRLKDDALVRFLGGGVGREDLETGLVRGENAVGGENSVHIIHRAAGSVTWYRPDWALGNHEFKAGFGSHQYTNWRSLDEKPFNYHLFYVDGEPFEIAFFNAPVRPLQKANNFDAYVRDSWTIGRRLTLNAGLRYSRQAAFVPQQCHNGASAPSNVMFPGECFQRVDLATVNSVAPRLRAALDVSGDGRTVIKGGWGRYDHLRALAPDALRLNRNSIAIGVFQWRDLNGNDDYDAGEVNLDPNGPDFVTTTGNDFENLPPRFVLNPDEKSPKVDEYSLSVERELISNFAVRVTGLHVRVNNVTRIQNDLRPYDAYSIPVANQDPGPDGRVGSGDDGGVVRYFEFAPALAGARFEEFTVINDPSANQRYSSIELAGVKRLSNRWQFMASYSATKKDRPINPTLAVSGYASTHEVGFFTPNDEINRADRTWDWDAKLSGSYTLPADVVLSGNVHHTSGDAFARTVLFRGGQTIPSIVLNVEPIGTRRLPSLNNVTFRIEKGFRVGAAQRLGLQLNLYNVLNVNTATALEPRSGAAFLATRAIMIPRLVEVGATYTF